MTETIDTTPLLTYAFLPSPNPLAASGAAQLTLVVSNSTSQQVTVSSIVVDLRVGVNAKDLTASADGIGTVLQPGWSAAQSGGVFTFTPSTPADAMVGARGLTFVFTDITVNDQPGSVAIGIGEEASAHARPKTYRSAQIALAKFPPAFALSDLTVSPTSVTPGSPVTLGWSGSAATYELSYDPDGNGPQQQPVGQSGSFTAKNLSAPIVVFTLTATVIVAGEDDPLIVQRLAVVTVAEATLTFTALPSIVAPNGVVKLAWQTTSTSSRTLAPGGTSLAAEGFAYVIVPRTTTFTLTAIEAGTGRRREQQQSITVDPTIVATSTIDLIGQPPGTPGLSFPYTYTGEGPPAGPGGPGGNIGDVVQQLGPLDVDGSSQSVVAIVYRGGAGGAGGAGSSVVTNELGINDLPGAPGGPGGKGGDAGALTLQLSASGQPQQLIVILDPATGGAGGAGGTGVVNYRAGNNGANGQPGAAGKRGTVTFVEVP